MNPRRFRRAGIALAITAAFCFLTSLYKFCALASHSGTVCVCLGLVMSLVAVGCLVSAAPQLPDPEMQ